MAGRGALQRQVRHSEIRRRNWLIARADRVGPGEQFRMFTHPQDPTALFSGPSADTPDARSGRVAAWWAAVASNRSPGRRS